MNKKSLFFIGIVVGSGIIIFAFMHQERTRSSWITYHPKTSYHYHLITPVLTASWKNKQYRSTRLGITFSYPDHQGTNNLLVQETGNKIYLYFDNQKPEEGQYIEILAKNSFDTIEDAIKAHFFTTASEPNCFVQRVSDYANLYYPSGDTMAIITFHHLAGVNIDAYSNGKNCPHPYTADIDGVNYFLTTPKSPTTYVYVHSGYGIIYEDTDKPWQETIAFL